MIDIKREVQDNTIIEDPEIEDINIEEKISDNDLEVLNNKLKDWETKYMYLLADLDNTKKRYNKIIEGLSKYDGQNIFIDLLDIVDYIEMSQQYTDNNNYDFIYKSLQNIFQKNKIELAYKNNRPVFFDEKYDDAIYTVETNDKNLDNTINQVLKKGYLYKDKVLRYEQVSINKYKEDINNE